MKCATAAATHGCLAAADPAALALPDLAQPSGSGFIEFAPSALVFADGARFVADRIGFNGSQVYGNGSGDLVVRGNEVVLANGAVLQSDTLAGPEGDILVDAGFLLLTTGAAIRTFADPGGAADGGSIHVMADTAIIEAGGNLRAFSDGPGNAGKVGVEFVHKVAQRNHYGIHDGKAIGMQFPGRIRRGI